MQVVSNLIVNHPEPLSLQVVCNQGNHSLWLKQVKICIWVLQFTRQGSLRGNNALCCVYCSLAKKGPWALYLTLSPDKGWVDICDIAALATKKRPPTFTLPW